LVISEDELPEFPLSSEIKASLANAEPYEEWLESAQYNIKDLDVVEPELAQLPVETTTLLDRQQAFGYTQEDVSKFLEPMGRDGDDPVGSMGTDTPIAVLSDKPKLLFNYFKYDKDRRETLDQGISFGGETVPAGSFVKGELKYQVASLVYDYSVVDTDTFDLGLQLGAEYAKVSTKGYADLGTVYEGQFLNEKADGVAPVVGARMTFTPSERWMITLQGQYLNTRWGSFDDYKGDLSRANAIVDYRFTKNFGVFAGYDWFKLDVDKKGSDGTVGLKQEFKGPVAGISFVF